MTDDLLLSIGRERRDEHDELCPCFSHPDWLPEANCRCDLIAQVGERIARAIEEIEPFLYYGKYLVYPGDAARIARSGGHGE